MQGFLIIALFAGCMAVPAVAQPGSPEPGTAVTIASRSDERPQVAPALAYDGAGTFLVVWQQGVRYYEQQQADIFAARIDRTGKILDVNPIVVTKAAQSQELPLVAFSDGVFLVVWQDYRSAEQWDVYGARVTPEGRVLEQDGFPIASQTDSEALPQIATAPGGFTVVWQALANNYYQMRGAHVSSKGAVTPFALRYNGNPLFGGDPALTRTTSGWLLSWNDEKSWSLGGIITRRFARLAGDARAPAVTDVHIAPAIYLGGEGGRLIAAGNRALYVSAQVGGRGQRVWTSTLLDAANGASLPNPNHEERWTMSWWDTAKMIPVVPKGAPVEGVVAGDFACDRYLLMARAPPPDKGGSEYSLVAAQLTADGARDESKMLSTIYRSRHPLSNPVLQFGAGVHLLVFDEQDETSVARLRAIVLKAACS